MFEFTQLLLSVLSFKTFLRLPSTSTCNTNNDTNRPKSTSNDNRPSTSNDNRPTSSSDFDIRSAKKALHAESRKDGSKQITRGGVKGRGKSSTGRGKSSAVRGKSSAIRGNLSAGREKNIKSPSEKKRHDDHHDEPASKKQKTSSDTAEFHPWGGVSLNNELLQGPNLANNLKGVLVRSRQDNIAVIGDIESMFYQDKVPRYNKDCLRYYWWIDENPTEYRMSVHLFGATSLPSGCNYGLQNTLLKSSLMNLTLRVTDTVTKNMYVDD
ncbi:unnamed protein product [Mytilus coruscus]|uniref:Uncharacterized protein n=1 Tax=Mytilus coruscus TaxID=42192 RepID=A0A6J8B5A2_MYTCO|nr:unnamed protein product [Mytilus coruscus]